ncbi:TPA: BNR-4 repeat-containing protein [Raoultella ornithinolytica]|nr:BNR-4 repeat-containing protein [Raoultella ornithinolytica]
MAYVPPVGETTDPDIFLENVKRADRLVSGPAGTVADRGGEPLDTWRQMMAKNDEIRQNIIPLGKQYMTLAAAQADIANIPAGSTTYYRSPDDSALAIEVINNSGTLEPTGRRMISKKWLDYLAAGVYPISAAGIWQITSNFIIFSGGTSGTYTDWDAYFLPCKKGDIAEYFGVINTATVGRVDAWIIQCDADKNYVADLATHTSDGSAYSQGLLSGTAIQDGYFYVRVKKTTNPGWYINFYQKKLVTSAEVGVAGGVAEFDIVKALADNGATIDYTGNANYYTTGTIIDLNGVVNNAAGNDWLAYYIPVAEGDKATMSGIYGSTTVGQQMAYFIQLDKDKNFIEPLDIYVSTGSNNVQDTRSAVASQDGFMYVRVRRMRLSVVLEYSVEAMQRNHKLLRDIYALQVEVDDLRNREVTQVPFIGASLEKLPVKFDNRFNYNAAAYIQDNVVAAGDYIYAVGTQEGKTPVILQKNVMTGVWSKFDLSTVPGNPLASPTADDSHNVYSLGVTKDGYLLISGNMHVNACRCIISTNPHDVSSWQAITYTDSECVTYPRFVKYPDGTTQAFWREGLSSSGLYYSATFNDTTRLFGTKRQVIQTDLTVNAYEQRLGIDRFGRLHLCFGLRESGAVADSNRGLFYARSSDKGATWTNATGSANYPLPLTETNSEKIADIPLFTGYVNQCGGACDFSGRYHTAIWQNDENNLTQIMHIWFDGSVWQREIVSKFDFKMDVSKGLLDGSLSRPVVGCTRYNKTWIFYRTTEMGRSEQIRAIDVTTPGAPVEHILAGFNAGFLELAINTNTLMDDNNVLMLATRGAIGFAQTDYARYTAESGYLLMAAMP